MALPDIVFAEGDARALAEKLKGVYEAVRRVGGEPAYSMARADPIRLVQLSEAAILAQVNTDIDITGKSNLLRYAGEETIEDLGLLYGKRGERLQPGAATATIEYALSTARNTTVTIPAGSRTTPDNKVFFATVEPLNIPAGDLFGQVRAKCQTAGTAGNGFAIGEIRNIVDRVPFLQSAANITESAGGADLEPLEEYRARIQLLPESFSTGGPEGAYRFWAMSANADIIDVAIWSPAPVEVNIVPLMRGGEIPTREVLDAVYEVCSDRTKRPLTDCVHVLAPRKVDYRINFRYWLWADDAMGSVFIQAKVAAAVEAYKEWQSVKLGRDLNPSVLTRMVMQAGAKRLEITEPVFTVLEHDQVGIASGPDIISYGGLENA